MLKYLKTKYKFLLMLMLIVSIFTGCSVKQDSMTTDSSYIESSDKVSEMMPGVPNENVSNEIINDSSKNESTTIIPGVNQKIIKSAYIIIESIEYGKSLDGLKSFISENGGYIENLNTQNGDFYGFENLQYASVQIRIPSDKYDYFIDKLSVFGHITSEQLNANDVSEQYIDTESRLEVLKIKESRLIELLKKSTKIEDTIYLENELSNVLYSIESLTGSLKKLDNLIDYSTVTVELREVEEITKEEPLKKEGFFNRLYYSFGEGFSSFFKLIDSLIMEMARNIVLIVTLAVLTLLLIKNIKKDKERLKKAHKEEIDKQ